ncbi:MAG: hypothetical protein K9N49_07830 [Candidatus Marinimicrobia bacterium]|nr:hypothetical protein [Candidatus Neomarinimicrobiota bacterium]
MKNTMINAIQTMAAMSLLATTVAFGAEQPNPYLKADDSWISISGTAVNPMDDSFTLDYGPGTVTVEVGDWVWYSDNKVLIDGDKVTVYGRIDDDLFETTSIEASSVYVESLGSYFYATAATEEYGVAYDYWFVPAPIVVGSMNVRGTVTMVSGREFMIDTGTRTLKVDTSTMGYNPMDDLGYQQIDKGDLVSVTGGMDYDTWEQKELMADTIVVLGD